jgi:hypothetical protein
MTHATHRETDTERPDGTVWQQARVHAVRADRERGVVEEAPRETPVVAEVDVAVVGGGPSGVGAALAAAEQGASVLLLERHGMLGGIWTAGLVNPFFDPYKGWIVDRLIGRLKSRGAWEKKGFDVFDVEQMKYVLEGMATEAGVEFWYHCPATDPVMKDGCGRGVVFEGKSGREALLARMVVDCSGDGDIAARAGVPYQVGRPRDGYCQPMTLMFQVTGFSGLGDLSAEELRVRGIYEELQSAIQQHALDIELPFGPQRFGAPAFIPLPQPGVAAVQTTHVYKHDATDTRQLSRATAAARRQVHEVFLPAMRKIPGMEDVRLTQTAPQIGVRESRRLEGEYRLQLEDMLEARHFDDAVTCLDFNIDIHEIDPADPTPSLPPLPEGVSRAEVPMCDLPFRCLVRREVDGLLFAGRCISGSHCTHAAYRVTGTCMATGQAGGLAAAEAASRSVSPRRVDGKELHRTLAARGAKFLGD